MDSPSTYNLLRNFPKTLLYENNIQTQICSNAGPQHLGKTAVLVPSWFSLRPIPSSALEGATPSNWKSQCKTREQE